MASLPPPTGRPATMFPRPDPWAEQARRQQQHREERRRRRRKWLIPAVVLLVVTAGVIAGFLVNEMLIERGPADSVVATEPEPSTATTRVHRNQRFLRINWSRSIESGSSTEVMGSSTGASASVRRRPPRPVAAW